MRKPYFPANGGPAPLTLTVERRVRFEEADPLAIVWHGRYASYFEDAREALGSAHGVGYLDFYRRRIATPIRVMHADYLSPLRYPARFTVQALLHYTEAARMNYEFVIRDEAGNVATTGYTVQVFVDESQNLLVTCPDFYLDFLRRWREGELSRP
ncbi:MAG: acyl-CoA thioesterase [Thermodesulfobacteriota bacterium]